MRKLFKNEAIFLGLLVLPFLAGAAPMGSFEKSKQVQIFDAVTGEVKEVGKIYKTDAEWKKILTPEQYRVARLGGTENPDTAHCQLPKEKGLYRCVCCGTDLFNVETEFESGTGWPSFWQPVSELNIIIKPDNSLGMRRKEVLCARCDAHLGHVFDDGPAPTGKRYCINAAALIFAKAKKVETATFAAGCFWGAEAAFRPLKGVLSTRVGYTGGHFKNPTYEDVCSDKTGHAEAVEVKFDPAVISYSDLLDVFWKIHDPTTLNRQGPDIGSQYRSAIFYHSLQQKEIALASTARLKSSGRYKEPIVNEIVAAGEFYTAEEYHQRYYEKHGIKGCGLHLEK